ncbi:MAG: GntR family transcriptional regulator [Firmicutes bacterium]|nr:GntR family transcriptional regulator [Bacillota bacterium]
MATFGFGRLNGLQLEYINGINMTEYYAARGSFIATKLLQKLMLQFSTSGKLLFSNKELMDTFDVTRRGLQISISELEAIGIVHRTFADPETKYIRTGFTLDVDMAIDWLKLTRKDVEERPRGDLCKHFVMQAVIKVKMFARDLRKIMRINQNQLERKEIQDKLEKINEKQAEYESHIKYVIKRVGKYLSMDVSEAQQDEKEATFSKWMVELEYRPPTVTMN